MKVHRPQQTGGYDVFLLSLAADQGTWSGTKLLAASTENIHVIIRAPPITAANLVYVTVRATQGPLDVV